MDRFEYRMSRRRYRSGAPGIALGAMIVVIGAFLLLDNLGIVHVHDVWRFWPVALVVWGVSRIFESLTMAGYVWGGLIALIGAFLLLDNLGIVMIDFDVIWPVLIIAAGAMLLLRGIEHKRYMEGVQQASSDDSLGAFAVFSGVKRKIDSQDFRGGNVVAVFGGVQIDLRHAAIKAERAVIDLNLLFGGAEVRVPENWTVTVKGIGIFGTFDDKTLHAKPDPNVKQQELVITGAALFGGAKVEN